MVGFQTPKGVKDEIFKEFQIKKDILKKIEKIFDSFSYREVSTPTIEYYDIFSSISSTVLKDDIFKFIDTSGEILALRPDATIPIARIVANNYKENKNNYKLWYKTQVFKMNNEKSREITQTGAEYFGNCRPESDAEIIVLAIKILSNMNLNFKIEIGNAGYFKGFLEEINISDEKKEEIKDLISSKNLVDIQYYVESLDIDEKLKRLIVKIPNLYGNIEDTIKEAEEYCLNDNMRDSLKETKEIVEILEDFGVKEFISLDLGLVNHIDYYTGMVFKGYIDKYGDTVLSGGRYDTLTRYYGESIPATGFAINIDNLINGVYKDDNKFNEENFLIDYKIYYRKKNRKSAIKVGEFLRDKGSRVELKIIENNGKLDNVNAKVSINVEEDELKLTYNDGSIENITIDRFMEKESGI